MRKLPRKTQQVTRTTGNRRLIKLAELLEANAKSKKGIRFNISLWGSVQHQDDQLSCGTEACAMGLAAISGAFKRQGLTCEIHDSGCVEIIYNRRHGPIVGAQRLFNLTHESVLNLFVRSDGLPTCRGAEAERAVAQRIRDFVAQRTAP